MFHQPPPHGYPSGMPAYPPQYGQQVYQQPGFTQDFYGGRPPSYYDRSDARIHFPVPQPAYAPPVLYPPQEIPVRISPVRESGRNRDGSPRRRSAERRSSPRRKWSRSPRRSGNHDRSDRKSPGRTGERRRSRSRTPVRSSRRPSPPPVRKSPATEPGRRKESVRGEKLSPARQPSPHRGPVVYGAQHRSPLVEVPSVSTAVKKEKYYDTKITIVNDRRRPRAGEPQWTGTWMELNSLLERKRVAGRPHYEGASIDVYKDMEELRRITVEIRRRINGKPSSGLPKRDLIPEDFVFIRRAGEGLKPIFDRSELALNEERSVVVRENSPEKKVVHNRERERDLSVRDARSPPRHRSLDRRPDRGPLREERTVGRGDRPDDRHDRARRDDAGRPRPADDRRPPHFGDERIRPRPDDVRMHRHEDLRQGDIPSRHEDLRPKLDHPRHDDIRERERPMHGEIRPRLEDNRRRHEEERHRPREDDRGQLSDRPQKVRREDNRIYPQGTADRFDDHPDNLRRDRSSDADLRYQLERRRSEPNPETIRARTPEAFFYPVDQFRESRDRYEPYPQQPMFNTPANDYRPNFDFVGHERNTHNQAQVDRGRIPATERIGDPSQRRMQRPTEQGERRDNRRPPGKPTRGKGPTRGAIRGGKSNVSLFQERS